MNHAAIACLALLAATAVSAPPEWLAKVADNKLCDLHEPIVRAATLVEPNEETCETTATATAEVELKMLLDVAITQGVSNSGAYGCITIGQNVTRTPGTDRQSLKQRIGSMKGAKRNVKQTGHNLRCLVNAM
ncbi:hypothetical protein TRVL_07155 [Trypanosoma vivax]|nr:hypothetical protein TRVL_07155 [Trypanosoma vivax]